MFLLFCARTSVVYKYAGSIRADCVSTHAYQISLILDGVEIPGDIYL